MKTPEFTFHHSGVNVPDLEEAIRWYHDVLGFDVESRFTIPTAKAQVAMMIKGDLRVEIFQVEGAKPLPDERRVPLNDLKTHGNKHSAFCIDNLDDFLAVMESKNVDIAFVVKEKFGRGCFIRDCAGNLIEFVEAS